MPKQLLLRDDAHVHIAASNAENKKNTLLKHFAYGPDPTSFDFSVFSRTTLFYQVADLLQSKKCRKHCINDNTTTPENILFPD